LFFRDYTADTGSGRVFGGIRTEGGGANGQRAIMRNSPRPARSRPVARILPRLARGATKDGYESELSEKEARSMATKTATAVKKVRELTDEEILKAPEKDYMNDAQLAFFKRKLLELRDQLLQNADDTGEHLRENEITTDPSDRATLEEEYTLELRTRDRERKLLKKVEKSLRMIDDGSYGWCEETGEPIGVPRLIARPTATLSLEAQERRERVQKLYGD
jgi:DnaK suppressor protein